MDIDQDHKLGNVCQICDVKFASKQNMERHVLEKHGNTDPEKCLQCSKTFTRKDSLELHIKNVHDKSLKSLKCEKCDKTFNKMSNLDRHRRDVHKKEKWFRCPKDTCPEEFAQKSNYDRHLLRDKHSVIITCPFCGKNFMSRSKAEEKRHYVKEWGKRPHTHVFTCRKRKILIRKMKHDTGMELKYNANHLPTYVKYLCSKPIHSNYLLLVSVIISEPQEGIQIFKEAHLYVNNS